jgi:hypothetical protein
MGQKVINNSSHSISLDGGEILAAHGTPGYIKTVELTDGDKKRHLARGHIAIAPEEAPTPAAGSKSKKDEAAATSS